jgi:hypothetical protein
MQAGSVMADAIPGFGACVSGVSYPLEPSTRRRL